MTFSNADKSATAKTPASQSKPATPSAREIHRATPSNSPHLNHQMPLNPDSMLYLQRTIGNQSTLRWVTPRIQRGLDFDRTAWHKGKAAKTLTSGVNAVFGIDNLVIKALESGGAQQQFASQVYGDLVEAPRTRAVPVDSDEGRAIVFLLGRKKLLPETGLSPKISVLLVMEKAPLRSMEDFVKELGTIGDDNPQELAKNKIRKAEKEVKDPTSFDSVIDHIFASNFFSDLGSIHAIDIFLGNSDRMDRYGAVAMQNIFINVSSGNYGSLGLDLDVEAASLAMVKSAGTTTGKKSTGDQKRYETSDADKYKNWVLHSIKGADAQRDLTNTTDPNDIKPNVHFRTIDAPGAMDSTDVTALFDPARIALAINTFKSNLEKWFPKPPVDQHATNERERRGDMIGTPYYKTTLWPLAHKKFAEGIDRGLIKIKEGMQPGGRYEDLYKESVANNPREAVFDFAVLKIRAKYFELKQDRYHPYTEAEIMTRLEAFAKRLDEGWGRL